MRAPSSPPLSAGSGDISAPKLDADQKQALIDSAVATVKLKNALAADASGGAALSKEAKDRMEKDLILAEYKKKKAEELAKIRDEQKRREEKRQKMRDLITQKQREKE